MTILEKAQIVSNELANFRKFEKAKKELYSIQDGRGNLTLQLLELDHHRVSKAIDTADKELDSLYTSLTSKVV